MATGGAGLEICEEANGAEQATAYGIGRGLRVLLEKVSDGVALEKANGDDAPNDELGNAAVKEDSGDGCGVRDPGEQATLSVRDPGEQATLSVCVPGDQAILNVRDPGGQATLNVRGYREQATLSFHGHEDQATLNLHGSGE
ncbi:hypothetical protein QR680_018517 [Steinernema hermaphroditum]|uniref:Uncharacterized protein n=1 Tax=Steinernema hermaphroditum TaxID=289476 RepID=A0AA39HI70_9BILA|nr:hypothetical protein QR680_018517 [Steinernema hermaphroditum]